jgi:putative hydrolase of the HAD superfamily
VIAGGAEPRSVVFDLFGTLVPEFPLPSWEVMFEGMADAVGADVAAFRRAWDDTIVERQTGGFRDMAENVEVICARVGLDPSADQVRRALAVREDLYAEWFRPQPGAVETLRTLRERGMPLALASNCALDAPAMWAASPLDGLIDVLVFSSEVGLRKPDPAIYLLTAERLGVEPAACLFVGDGANRELTGAAAVGMMPVRIVDDAEDGPMLRPDRDDWEGTMIRSVPEVLDLLEGG